MEKTIEYMRTAVLAECERLLPTNSASQIQIDDSLVLFRIPWGAYNRTEWSIGHVGMSQKIVTIDSSPNGIGAFGAACIFIFYKLLGLSERDAVEAERAEMMKTVDALSAMVSVDHVAYSDLEDALEAEKEKSKRWESRAWKILQIVRRRETEQRPKTAAVLRTLREVSEKNEQLVTALEDAHAEIVVNENRIQCAFILNQAIEAYKEGKKDE